MIIPLEGVGLFQLISTQLKFNVVIVIGTVDGSKTRLCIIFGTFAMNNGQVVFNTHVND